MKGCVSVWQLVPNPYVSVRSDGSLHLERVRLQDSGDYTCMASSVAGTSNSTTTVHVFGEWPALGQIWEETSQWGLSAGLEKKYSLREKWGKKKICLFN